VKVKIVHVVVLGAGVVGVTTAHALRQQGFAVTIIDRHQSPAQETSFANGGQIAAAHADPWASPETPLKALKWLGKRNAPLLFHLHHKDPDLWRWAWAFLKNCTSKRAAINTERTVRIALYSRKKLQDIRNAYDLNYDQKSQGILHFYRQPREYEHALKGALGRSVPSY